MTDAGPGPLTPSERTALTAVCETLCPRLTPGAGDAADLFGTAADDVALAAAVEAAIALLSARQIRELRLFLRLLESRVFMGVVAGRVHPISCLSHAQREEVLRRMANSLLPQVRTGYQALKRLSTFLFYSLLRDDGRNPAWRALDYEVPRPSPGVAPLRITRTHGETTLDADACVVGSGAGGSVVAARLAAAGQRVVVLEAGAGDQGTDYDQRELIGMQRLYLDQGTTATRDLGVAILAGSCVGGGTTVNWQTSLRTPDFIRDEWSARSGIRYFREEEFTRALDAVWRRLDVSTSDSVRNGNNAALERGCQSLGISWTEVARNSRGCDQAQCGFCVFGCRLGAKRSTVNTYLDDAQGSGNATIVAECRAERVRRERGRVIGVDGVARTPDGRTVAVRVNAPLVVVACGGIESPALLLRSGIELSQLGRNLFLHPTTAIAGRYDTPIHAWQGAPQTAMSSEFAQERGNYGYRLEVAPMHPGLIALAFPWTGARDHRRRMQESAHVSAIIVLVRDQAGGRVRVDDEGRAVIHYRPGAMERRLLREGMATAADVHWAAGAAELHSLHTRRLSLTRDSGRGIDRYCADLARRPVHGNRCALFSAHQMGTCRMGSGARDAVCDENGQVFGTKGLYVADASLFPASSGVNPMITIMALAHVVAERIVATT
jgi:choline dehydrogenase-like flavoprotein